MNQQVQDKVIEILLEKIYQLEKSVLHYSSSVDDYKRSSDKLAGDLNSLQKTLGQLRIELSIAWGRAEKAEAALVESKCRILALSKRSKK